MVHPFARALLVVVALVGPVAAQEDAPPPLDGTAERLEALVADARALRDELRAARTDLGDVALELAFEDAEAIAAWVSAHVAYEPYAGLLRGPAGTVAAGRANALDQAVLLARLLGDAGYDAEVALGTLGEADAVRLLRSAAPPSAPPPLPERFAARRDALEAGFEALLEATTPAALRPDAATEVDLDGLRADAARDAAALIALLERAGGALGGDPGDRLLAEARAYAWVRVREGADGWRDLHPALDPPPSVALVERFAGAVPDAHVHRIELEVVLERRRGDALETVPVAGPIAAPAASFADRPATLVLAPMRGVDVENVFEGPADGFVVPVLAGSLDGARAFDPATGATLAPEDAAAPAAGVVREVARGFGAAAAALGTGSGEVTALYLDVALHAPDGGVTRWRRALVDRIGAANRAEGRLDLAEPAWSPLRTAVSLTVATHAVPESVALERRLDAFLEAADPLRFLLGQAERPDVDALMPAASPWPVADAGSVLAALDAGAAVARPAPTLVLRQTGLAGPDEAPVVRSWVDVLSAPVRVLAHDAAGTARLDAVAALRAGVALSHLEVLPLRAAADAEARSAPDVLVRAQEAGATLTVVRPGPDADAFLATAPAEARAALAADLAAGRLLIVADAVPADLPYAWWAVDLTTGDALGRLGEGRGGALTETVVLVGLTAVTVVASFAAWMKWTYTQCHRQLEFYVFLTQRPDARREMLLRCVWGNALVELRGSLRF